MTVRVALVGDSHLASLALAARSMELGPLRPTFFAHVLRRMEALRVSGGRLHADTDDLREALRGTSGGLDRIDPERYDLFVLMGLEFEPPLGCLGPQHVTRAVTEQTLRDQLSASLAFATLEKLRQITDRPVWLLHTPLPDEARGPRSSEALTYDRFLELANEVCRPTDATVVPQPEETRVGDFLSASVFSAAPVRLEHATGAPLVVDEDACHKNEAFGRAVLEDLRRRLARFPQESRRERSRVHPLTNVDEGHLGGYLRASTSMPGFRHGDPQTWEPKVWKWAVDTFAADSVLDVGCGEAHSTKFFRDLGCRVLGVDGSLQAKESSLVPDRHVRHDFVDGPFIPEQGYDLVWSCEFVEHVEERFLGHFLATFAAARKAVLMTFASTGQPGWHHVNCQGVGYWIERIQRLGFRFDRGLTDQGRTIARGIHFGNRGLVFVRVLPPPSPRRQTDSSAEMSWDFRRPLLYSDA